MKKSLIAFLSLSVLTFTASAAEKKAPEPHPTTQTFFVAGVQCDNCVNNITESIQKVKSVTKVEGLTAGSGYVNVSFDSHKDSFHQIAQAIAAATPAHGEKYAATMKLKVADYSKGDNAAKVDGVFAKSKDLVKVKATDKAKGEFEISFLPLTVDASKEGPQGFNGGRFGHPIGDPAPKGLGLKALFVREGVVAAKAAPKKK